MANELLTKREAQEKAVEALSNAEFYSDGNSINYNRVSTFSGLALAYATLALSLPDEKSAPAARPFRDVVG